MELQNKQKDPQKINEILETLRILGVDAKSFTINFSELPVHLSVHRNEDCHITCANHQFKKTFDPGKKMSSTP